MFPLGTHKARAVDCVLGMTGTGKEQVGVLFEHVETGERITWYGYFTDGTFERTIESLRYMGWQGTDLLDFRQGLPAGCDNEVDVVVEDETDERDGKVRRKVRWVNGNGGVAVKETLDDAQARVFAARMKAKVAALHAKTGGPKPASKPKPPSRVAQSASGEVLVEDDIPF